MNEGKDVACMLEKDPARDKECSRIQCETCGWNPEVRDLREAMRRAGGMKQCADGLTRLVLASAEADEEKANRTNDAVCQICGKIFIKHRIDQKCCSTECGRKLGAITVRERRKKPT